MKTRAMLSGLLFSFCVLCAVAQQKAPKEIYLLESFAQGNAYLKNKSLTTTTFNYDPINRKMNYYDGSTKMVLEGTNTIDSVVMAGRKFIPYQRYFLEMVSAGDNTFFIDWKVRLKNKGKEGVLGSRTQGSVTSLDVSRLQNMGMGKTDVELYDISYENTYYLYQNGKLKKFTNAKSFVKLYPTSEQDAIESFIQKEQINFQQAEEVLKLVEKF